MSNEAIRKEVLAKLNAVVRTKGYVFTVSEAQFLMDAVNDSERATYRNGIRVEPDEGYNGWTNAETWHTKLCLDNDEGSYTYWREQTAEHLADAAEREVAPREAVYFLADALRDEHEDIASHAVEDAPFFVQQFVQYGLGAVNWIEIAESLIDEAKEEA